MKAYYFSELAQLYFPNSTIRSAVYQLHQWINLNNELKQELTTLHYVTRQRSLTPLQIQAIFKYIGEPY